MAKYSLHIILLDGTDISAQDEFNTEDEAINQCQMFATNGYYSRVVKSYWPPHRIGSIKVVPKDDTNK